MLKIHPAVFSRLDCSQPIDIPPNNSPALSKFSGVYRVIPGVSEREGRIESGYKTLSLVLAEISLDLQDRVCVDVDHVNRLTSEAHVSARSAVHRVPNSPSIL